MEYDCEIVPATRVLTDFNKVIHPLCTTCSNSGCSNPIVEQKISVFGMIKTTRIYDLGDTKFYVLKCEGYHKMDEGLEMEEEQEE
jgi:hypothetical protein